MDALYTSLDFRVTATMPDDGYQMTKGNFLLGVTHSVLTEGERELTWGMWTVVLTGMSGYVQAYPGYDFSFEIRLMAGEEEIEGHVIGTGFAMTRGH